METLWISQWEALWGICRRGFLVGILWITICASVTLLWVLLWVSSGALWLASPLGLLWVLLWWYETTINSPHYRNSCGSPLGLLWGSL